MDKKEFYLIVKRLKSVYRQANFIADEDAFGTWFSYFQHLDYDLLMKSANDWISRMAVPPTIAGLNDTVKKVRKETEVRNPYLDYRKIKTVRCPKCNDMGGTYIWKDKYGNEVEHPLDEYGRLLVEAYEFFRVCDCAVAKEKYPSLCEAGGSV